MKTNTLIIIAAVVIVAAAAYWYIMTQTGNDMPLSTVPAASSAQVQFETLAGRLPTSFNTSIFTDERFLSLVDITQPISPEPSGRIDPLAPLTGVTGTR
ncbi:MAG: hypothetical protein AAB442_00765 [Patescibacteria group bacterium]